MNLPNKKQTILGLVALLIVLQFFRIDKTNPSSDPGSDYLASTNAGPEISQLLKSACYDCHSHESKYPWYTNIQPVGWWIKSHINGGRQHLNFSEWTSYTQKKKDHKTEEVIEEIKSRHMPMKSYTWAHSEARLSDDDIATLVTWFEGQ